MTDSKLIELLIADRNAGMTALIKQYSGFVFAIVRPTLADVCDSSEIEDCVYDVFMNFYSALHRYKPDASIKSYLGVIARNASLSILRNRVPAESLDNGDLLLKIPDGPDMSQNLEEKELLERVFGRIRLLGRPDSDIIFRKYYLGQSSKQIAEALKMTVSNVDTRAHRALLKLRKKFEGEIL